MDFYTVPDKAIAAELGLRLKSLRLRQNTTQQQLADAVAVSVNSIKALEVGRGKLATFIAVLRELNSLDSLNDFLPETTTFSPIQMSKQQGKRRQRASGSRGKGKNSNDQG